MRKKDFSAFLKARRKALGLTQGQMTERLREEGFDLTSRTYQNWEWGNTLPPGELASDVIEALGGLEALERKAPVLDLTRKIDTFGDRLDALRRCCSMGKQDFARKLGVTPDELCTWLKAEEAPEEAMAAATNAYPEVDPEWLRTGAGGVFKSKGRTSKGSNGDAPNLDIKPPVGYDINPGGPPQRIDDGIYRWHVTRKHVREAGNGAGYVSEEDIEVVARGEREVERSSGFDPEDLRHAFCDGPSMEPEIKANTGVLYLPQKKVDVSGIYYLRLDGRPVFKIIEVMGGGAIRLSAYNKDLFPDAELLAPLKEDGKYKSQTSGLTCEVEIIGRVIIYTKVV